MHGDESLDENEKLLRMHVHRLKTRYLRVSQDSVRGFDYMREDPKTSLYYVYQRGEQTYPVHLNEDGEYLRLTVLLHRSDDQSGRRQNHETVFIVLIVFGRDLCAVLLVVQVGTPAESGA